MISLHARPTWSVPTSSSTTTKARSRPGRIVLPGRDWACGISVGVWEARVFFICVPMSRLRCAHVVQHQLQLARLPAVEHLVGQAQRRDAVCLIEEHPGTPAARERLRRLFNRPGGAEIVTLGHEKVIVVMRAVQLERRAMVVGLKCP